MRVNKHFMHLFLLTSNILPIRAQTLRSCPSGTLCKPIKHCFGLSSSANRGRRSFMRNNICAVHSGVIYVCCMKSISKSSRSHQSRLKTVSFREQRALLPDICGYSQSFAKIVGGSKLSHRTRPWMAALGYQRAQIYSSQGASILIRGTLVKLTINGSRLYFDCGGAVINSRYILTAAHCVSPEELKSKTFSVVRLGTNSLDAAVCKVEDKPEACIDAGIEKIILHPDYDKRFRYSDDIALIRLNVSLDVTSPVADVRAVCLPPPGLDMRTWKNDTLLKVAGWGISEKGAPSDNLKESLVSFTDEEACRILFKEKYKDPIRQVCILGYHQKRTGSCSGDSGVPLIVHRPNSQQYAAIGLVSLGTNTCQNQDHPSVYTSVSPYKMWIVSQLLP